jgi:hypothetical protein
MWGVLIVITYYNYKIINSLLYLFVISAMILVTFSVVTYSTTSLTEWRQTCWSENGNEYENEAKLKYLGMEETNQNFIHEQNNDINL